MIGQLAKFNNVKIVIILYNSRKGDISIFCNIDGGTVMKYYLAIDLGASSGRHIVGWRDESGEIQSREVYSLCLIRWLNNIIQKP